MTKVQIDPGCGGPKLHVMCYGERVGSLKRAASIPIYPNVGAVYFRLVCTQLGSWCVISNLPKMRRAPDASLGAPQPSLTKCSSFQVHTTVEAWWKSSEAIATFRSRIHLLVLASDTGFSQSRMWWPTGQKWMPRTDKKTVGAWRGQCKLGTAGRRHGSRKLTSRQDRVFEKIESSLRKNV